MDHVNNSGEPAPVEEAPDRRRVLRQVGRFAAVTAPSVVLLLAAGSKPSQAQSKISLPVHPPVSSRQFKEQIGAVNLRLRRIGDLEERRAAG